MINILILIILIFIFFITFYLQKKNDYFTNYNNFDYSDNLNIENIKTLHTGQKIMTEMFREFDLLCRKNNIQYWCLGGTLIGCLRHGGWVPWDGDIDLGMLREDYNKFKKISYKLPSNIEFSEPKNKPCSKLRSTKANYIFTKWGKNWDKDMGLQIDLFLFKNENGKIKGNAAVCGIPDKTYRDELDIFPLKELKFENIKVYVPNKYEKISKELWGGHPPKIPNMEKRYPHEGNIVIKENFESNINENDKYFKDVMNDDEKKILDKLLNAILNHFNDRNLEYFFAFGSLIGVVRHGFRMPWDDDIDIAMNKNDLQNLLKGLKFVEKGLQYNKYYLSDNIYIVYKNFGVPIKIYYEKKMYPFIDIYLYEENDEIITIDKKQLIWGHIFNFTEKKTDIFPLKEAKFENYKVKIPNNYNKILKNQYGNNFMTECVISWNHKLTLSNISKLDKVTINKNTISKKYFKPYIF